MFLGLEAGLTILAFVLALTVPKLSSRWFEAIEKRFGRLARRQGLSVIVVGITALVLGLRKFGRQRAGWVYALGYCQSKGNSDSKTVWNE